MSNPIVQSVFKTKTFSFLAFLLFFLVVTASAQEQKRYNVTARSFVIMDGLTGKLLLSRRPHMLHPPASTLKMFTAMYVLKNLDMDDLVKVSKDAAAAPASKIYIKEGEAYTVRDLMYALLLSSANDGARALAERVSGSEKDFAQELTWYVQKWGAVNTVVANANGLPAKNQYTTAYDLALLFKMAMENPIIAEIMKTRYYDISRGRTLRNHNRFLFTTPLCLGGKTGWTIASRHTYVGKFRNEDKNIIIAMLGSQRSWADLRILIELGFDFIGAPVGKLPPEEERLWQRRCYKPNKSKGKSKQKRASRY